jgi:hypothetical protein
MPEPYREGDRVVFENAEDENQTYEGTVREANERLIRVHPDGVASPDTLMTFYASNGWRDALEKHRLR